jgi:uncharacterized membrane protein
MNLIPRLLGVENPENTRLASFDFSLRGLSLGWLALLILIILFGIVIVGLFYVLERGSLGWIRRVFLIGLRCTLLIVLLFLILRPILLAEFVGDRPRGVALVLDTSQSMTQRDRRLTEADKARAAMALGKLSFKSAIDRAKLPADLPSNPVRFDLVKGVLKSTELRLIDDLRRYGPMRPYTLGADVRPVHEDRDKSLQTILGKLEAAETKTALADGIVKIVQSKDVDPPAAIVVFTDGQDNASKFSIQEAALECARARIPLHIYGVGSSEGGQLQLKEVGAPDTLFVDDTVNLPLRWRAQGFKKGDVEITIKLGGEKVVEKKLTLQTGEDLRNVLNFVVPKDPQKRENLDLVATITYKSGTETFTDTLTRTVRIADSKIRILYVEHAPRWEFKFLQPALLRDRRVEVDFILINAAPDVAKGGKPFLPEFPKDREKFFDSKYNLIILGDVASSQLSRDQQEWIKEFVENRGGLIVMAGRQHMPSTYENMPIAEVLPVEFKKEKFGLGANERTQEYPPTLTPEGERADWLALADTPDENHEVWQKKLLGFHWYYPVTKLRPAASPLVVNPRAKMDEQPMPILATHYFGKGQVLWFGTDETWRWRWNYQDKYFVRFWGQIIYQMGLPSLLGESAKRAQMALERAQPTVGQPSSVFVRLLDKDFNPRKDLEHLDNKPGEERTTPITLNAIPGRPGDYSALVPHNRAGRYELRVKNPDVNTFSYRVELPPRHELEEAGLNEKVLRDAAEMSGGRFYREEDLHQLAGNIRPQTKEFTRRQEILLWNPLAIFVFLGLITVEWVVRKFADLT